MRRAVRRAADVAAGGTGGGAAGGQRAEPPLQVATHDVIRRTRAESDSTRQQRGRQRGTRGALRVGIGERFGLDVAAFDGGAGGVRARAARAARAVANASEEHACSCVDRGDALVHGMNERLRWLSATLEPRHGTRHLGSHAQTHELLALAEGRADVGARAFRRQRIAEALPQSP